MSWNEKTDAEKMRAILAVLPVQIGMACKNTGLAWTEWDNWSKTEKRYHESECEQKWRGFRKKGVEVGTALEICGRHGCKDQAMAYYDGESCGKLKVYDWDDELPAIDTKTPAPEPAKKEPTRKKPEGPPVVDLGLTITPEPVEEPEEWEPEKDMAKYLRAVFREGEWFNVCVNGRCDSGICYNVTKKVEMLEAGEGIENAIGLFKKENGAWVRINPAKENTAGSKDKDMADLRHALVECDGMDLEMQLGAIHALNLPCVAVVYSGGKSIHAIVRVDAGDDPAKYKRHVERLYDICEKNGLKVDRNNGNAGRLSRLAGCLRGEHKQFLIETNSGAESWAAWVKWYKKKAAEVAPDPEPEREHEKTEEDDAPIIPMLDAGEWLETPEEPPEAILSGWLGRGGIGFIVGASKMRKTFFTLQMAVSIATGRSFLGFGIKRPFKVLYLQIEVEKAYFQKRLEAMCKAMAIDKSSLKGRLIVSNLRGLPEDCKGEKAIRRALLATGADVLIIDPVYKLIDGDECDQKSAKDFIKELDRLGYGTGAAIVGVFHTPKLGKDTAARRAIDAAAGSGVFGRATDAQFVLSPHEKGKDYAILATECRNYATPEDKTLHFDDGRFVEEAATPAVPPSLDNRKKQQAEQAEITPEVVAGWFAKVGVPMNNRTLRAYLTDAGCGARVDALEKKISELKQAGVILEDEKRGPRGAKQYRPGPEAEEAMQATLTGADESDIPPF